MRSTRTRHARSRFFPRIADEAVVGEEDVVRLRLSQLRLERPRQWGGCWLAIELWRELGLDAFWAARLPPSRKGTLWDEVLLIMVVYRLLSPGSEWRLHREWYGRSALPDLLDAEEVIDPHALYACHALLLEHKAALFDHLVCRWRELFDVSFDVLLYDLTSTYFEIDPPLSEEGKRRLGYSRDHRPDCVQVVIALMVTPQGFPLAYEVLAGNTADNTTLKDFLTRSHRAPVRQGEADLADGPRHPHRGGARADAQERWYSTWSARPRGASARSSARSWRSPGGRRGRMCA